MQRIGGRRLEVEPLVKRTRRVVLGVNHDRADTGNVGHLQRAQNGVAQQPRADPLALPLPAGGPGEAGMVEDGFQADDTVWWGRVSLPPAGSI